MGLFFQLVRTALRRWRRRPGPPAIATGMLTVGIAAAAAIVSVTSQVIAPPAPWPDGDRLFVIRPGAEAAGPAGDRSSFTWAAWTAISQSAALEVTAAWQTLALAVHGEQAEVVEAAYVASAWLPLLGVQPAIGRAFTPAEDQASDNVAVISHGFWERHFDSDTAVIGGSVVLSYANPGAPRDTYTLVGVLPRHFQFDGIAPDVLLPLGQLPLGWRLSPQPTMRALGKLGQGVSTASAEAQLAAELSRTPDVDGAPVVSTVHLQSLIDDQLGAARLDGRLMVIAAMLVLLMAIGNHFAMMTLEAHGRRREHGLRVALGATRGRLWAAWAVESLLQGVSAGAAGTVLGVWLTGAVVAGLTMEGGRETDPLAADVGTLVVLVLGTILAVASGILSRFKQDELGGHSWLRNSHKGSSGGRAGHHRTLVAAALAWTFVIVFVSVLLAQTVMERARIPLGFEAEDSVLVRTAPTMLATSRSGQESPVSVASSRLQAEQASWIRRASHTRAVMEVIEAMPGVSGVAGVSVAPLFGSAPARRITFEAAPSQLEAARELVTTEEYFDVLRIPVLSGRAFTPDDPFQGHVVVSEAFDRTYLSGDGVGKRFTIHLPAGDHIVSVVGVVGDVYSGRDSDPPLFYRLGAMPRDFVVRVDRSAVADLIAVKPRIEKELQGTLVTMTATFAEQLALMRADAYARSIVAGVFGVMALAMSGIAVWMLAIRIGMDRRREMALRVAIGASRGDVIQLILIDGFKTAGLGVAFGALAAVATSQGLRAYLVGVPSFSLEALGLACLALLGLPVVAMLVPAVRVSRQRPLSVLNG